MFAVRRSVVINPDKAFYKPGEAVKLYVEAASGSRVRARVMYLAETAATLEAPVEDGRAMLTWTPPAIAPRGYGLDVDVLDEDNQVIGAASSAFDVLERWTQAPRYGFLSEFAPERPDPQATMQWAARYHLNGLQFYDWMYRHDTLLPPSESFVDLLARPLSMRVVNDLIDAAHRYNIAAMPYTAIYGASSEFFQQHQEWGLFAASGVPYRLGEDFLVIMNPSPACGWTPHLLNEYAEVLEKTRFDGIHIDTYGAPLIGLDANGSRVEFTEAFPAFINATADLVHARREQGAVIFNAVRNLLTSSVAAAQQDAVYIEVWEPYRRFIDLHRIVVRAQELGRKPVIIAAYIHPEWSINVRLANALIFASGGYHLELGEPDAMLADPYFPKFGKMDEQTNEIIRRYYDFLVRYENILSLETHDATAQRAQDLTIEGLVTDSYRSKDRVAVIVRSGEGFETFSLINLIRIDGEHWETPLTQPPQTLENLTIHLRVTRPVSSVYAASPDGETPELQRVSFTATDDDVYFTVSRLQYWNLLLVGYAS